MGTMKIERKDAEFKPVIITLETQEEVDTISIIMGCISGDSKNSPRKHVDRIHNELSTRDKPAHSGEIHFEDYKE